jgi:uncharacterized protein (TIGR02145 family)
LNQIVAYEKKRLKSSKIFFLPVISIFHDNRGYRQNTATYTLFKGGFFMQRYIKKSIALSGVLLAIGTSAQALPYIPPTVPMQGRVTQVIRRNDNTPLVFSLGTDKKLYYSYSKTDVVSFCPIWQQIAGTAAVSGNIAAISKNNGEIWLFARNSSNYVVYSKCPVSGGFSNWANVGGYPFTALSSGDVAAGLNTDGTIEVFAINANRNLFKIKQNSNGTWPSTWPSNPMARDVISDNLAVEMSYMSPAGRLQVFAKIYNPSGANKGQLLTMYQQSPGSTWTSSYSNLGGCIIRNIVTVLDNTNNLEVYGFYNDQIYRRVQYSMAQWTDWELLPTSTAFYALSLVKNPDGRLEAFYVGSDSKCAHSWQSTAGTWAGCGNASLGLPMTNKTINAPISLCLHPAMGRLMAFAYGSQQYGSNQIVDEYSIYQDYTMPGGWSPFVLALRPYDPVGHEYSAVKIGGQIWLGQNLNTSKFTDGTVIPIYYYDDPNWGYLTTPAYCWVAPLGNDGIEGGCYNWYTVNSGKTAIAGWSFPTDSDWVTLQTNCGGSSVAGGKLKDVGTTYWNSPNESNSSNSTKYTAIGTGYVDAQGHIGNNSYRNMCGFWTATPTTLDGYANAHYCMNTLVALNALKSPYNTGFSVRLIWK